MLNIIYRKLQMKEWAAKDGIGYSQWTRWPSQNIGSVRDKGFSQVFQIVPISTICSTENCFSSFPPLWMIPIKHPAPLSFVELISYQKLHFIFCSDLDLDFEARGLMWSSQQSELSKWNFSNSCASYLVVVEMGFEILRSHFNGKNTTAWSH